MTVADLQMDGEIMSSCLSQPLLCYSGKDVFRGIMHISQRVNQFRPAALQQVMDRP